MIDWPSIERALAQLAAASRPARLLSVTVSLPGRPGFDPAAHDDWCVWQRPETGLRLLGIGTAFVSESAGESRFAALHAAQRGLAATWRYRNGTPSAFVGFAFAPAGGTPLPNARLWVPELLVAESPAGITVTFSCPASEAALAVLRWQALWRALAKTVTVPPAPTFTDNFNPLADAAFLARGRAALRAIAAGNAEKLVLTRAVRCRADRPIAVAPVLAALADTHATCATFGVGQGGRAFVGASPETLLALDGERVTVDALAGTAWQASVRALGDDKNRREHDFVARAVAEALAAHCRDIVVPAVPEVMQLNALTHLRRRVIARRPADLSAIDLVARLHPTPAVGGVPGPATLDWLTRHGDHRPAWYTGGIGWINAAGDCDIAVALRCGLIEGDTATLYAGAGFVAGSDPEQELAETEAKFSAMREALAAGSPVPAGCKAA